MNSSHTKFSLFSHRDYSEGAYNYILSFKVILFLVVKITAVDITYEFCSVYLQQYFFYCRIEIWNISIHSFSACS
ncbi:hypothetical protein QR305_00924 [Bacteroides finegoldii]|uniref:Uncharacterized protein n=1 Tax=Bacteroides finegoldii CL09T03C10 TaxID=997888 RepID=K5CKH5_9BACE|nr:hypothetical protein HMPREF1057_02706 [Bacteroides finegoldii CL09T03C10]